MGREIDEDGSRGKQAHEGWGGEWWDGHNFLKGQHLAATTRVGLYTNHPRDGGGILQPLIS
jgi:hypothetical protein